MVTTRGGGRKRKDRGSFVYFDDAALAEAERLEEENRIAAEEEREREWRKKKRREEIPPYDGDHFALLPPEMLSRVFSFVASSTDIYNLSMCNKACRSVITSKMIIRSGVFGDKKTSSMLADIMKYIQNGSIRTPSKWRLLRLLNGRRCERMTDCFAFDVIAKKPNKVGNNRPFGLCLCNVCERAVGNGNILSWRDMRDLNTDRLATAQYGRLLVQDHNEWGTGDAIGPFVIGHKIKQILCSYSERQQQQDTIDELCKKAEELEEFESFKEELINTYLEAQTEREERSVAKTKKEMEEHQARQERKLAQKRELNQPVFEALQNSFEGYANQEVALSGDWCEWSGVRNFTYRLSRDVLGNLLSAPSSATNSKIEARVVEFKESLEYIHSLGIANGHSNLMKSLRTSVSPHIKAIYNYRHSLTKSGFLATRQCLNVLGRGFVDACRTEGLFAAIFPRLDKGDKKDAFVRYVLPSSTSASSVAELRVFQRKLAIACWEPPQDRPQHHWGRPHHRNDPLTPSDYRTKFQQAKAEYDTLSENLRAYMKIRRVKHYLNKTGPPAHRPNQNFSRRDALMHIASLKPDGAKRLLRNRDFAELLELHKMIFRSPDQFLDN